MRVRGCEGARVRGCGEGYPGGCRSGHQRTCAKRARERMTKTGTPSMLLCFAPSGYFVCGSTNLVVELNVGTAVNEAVVSISDIA